jgi:hypothetical protein
MNIHTNVLRFIFRFQKVLCSVNVMLVDHEKATAMTTIAQLRNS